MSRIQVTMDGNEAAAYVAYRASEVIAIYPITPSSAMGELSDEWAARGIPNLWGSVPQVVEMQSEGGAAGAVHGALQSGSLTTTFTASQGLLLMIPNMYKIAGELTSTVFHIAARSVSAQALSIFGDHSDVMATRATGFGMLFSNSVQEVMDFALIAHASALEARLPFLHIFDGFRTSHEVMKIEQLAEEDIRALIDDELVRAHRRRGLSPERPVVRGTAQNPDVFFQARETVNPYYLAAPAIVQKAMDALGERTGRHYRLFDYVGAPDAERVVVLMGSGVETAQETVEHLAAKGEKVGLLKVRLYRPFSVEHFLGALPATVRAVAVLDRTKEPGASGEPLYQDVVTAISEGMAAGTAPFASYPRITGGRYGLSSKEFTPAMVRGVLEELKKDRPKNHFTVGIVDDVTHTSLDYDPGFQVEHPGMTRALFWGLGSDGTVGANKNSIKIIGEETPGYAQGYFVYDSKKSGARTISHLRFGPEPIHSTYLISKANFVAVHQFGFLERFDTLAEAAEGATFLLNAPFPAEEVWDRLPRPVQETIIKKKLRFWVIDGYQVARDNNLGNRVNTIMQTCFFYLSGVLPQDEAIAKIKAYIKKTYGKRGEQVVAMNYAAVDAALAHLHEITVPAATTSTQELPPVVPAEAPEFVQKVTATIMAGAGDSLPVSAMPADGTYPSGTTRWEKRNIALEVPVWEEDICIQCGKCVIVCPHSVIRSKVYEPAALEGAPEAFKSTDARWRELKDRKYTLQVAVEDCTGCALCVEVCPAKDKSQVGRKAINMADQIPIREAERANWEFFLGLPDVARSGEGTGLKFTKPKDVQLLEPLFEFSGACAGCGETPYLRLMTQLFGDRTVVANATGCSSIYGGNLPTTPWTHEPGRARPGLVQLAVRGQRRVRDGHAGGPGQAGGVRPGAGREARGHHRRGAGRGAADRRPDHRRRHRRPAGAGGRPPQGAGREDRARGPGPDGAGRHAGPEDGVDRGRRRVGLRHRLRRAGPRPGLGPQREPAGPGHRGVLQHRRPGVEGHRPGGGGQVRRRREAHPQEGPGAPGHVLRLRLRGPDRHGGQRQPDHPGPAGGGELRRPLAGHRLQPLHRPRLRHGQGHEPAEAGRRLRLLAALPVRPAAEGGGEEPAPARLQGPVDPAPGLHLQREPLPHAGPVQPRGGQAPPGGGPGRGARALEGLRADGQGGGPASPAGSRRGHGEDPVAPGAGAETPPRPLARGGEAATMPAPAPTGRTPGAKRTTTMDLKTTYLGLNLKNPIVPSASPLSENLDNLRRMEDMGASAVVLYSLFEEEIAGQSRELDHFLSYGTESFAEALTYYPDLESYRVGPDEYLKHIGRCKDALGIPVLASLNGVSTGGWVEYAKEMEKAGADALELNIYYVATDPNRSSAEVEDMYLETVAAVKKSVSVPVAVKIGPFFSSMANMAKRLSSAGADGLVLFNRFYQPDFDLEQLEVVPHLVLSNSHELRLPLRWVAILHGRVNVDFAITSGVHTYEDVLKGLMAGARVTMMTSELLQHGIGRISAVLNDLSRWMEEHEYVSVAQMQGSMSQAHVAEPAAFERANYMKVIHSWRPDPTGKLMY